MQTIANNSEWVESEWVEDAALGVAMREVGGDLHVRALTIDGWVRLDRALVLADSHEWSNSVRAWVVRGQNRLAIARRALDAQPGGKDTKE
jgi:hypothetical protein